MKTEQKWWFPEDDSGTDRAKDPLAGLFTSRSELDSVDILVREALQNSLDARSSSDPVTVKFRLRTLQGDEKTRFLRELRFDTLCGHVRASNESLLEQDGDSFVDPDEVAGSEAIVVLYIEDYGTTGLIGREFKHKAGDPESDGPDCFLGLCRAIGRNDKARDGAGGTYGFGKGVYWAASSMGTVVFHSRLAHPWMAGEGELMPGEEKASVIERLFGVSRLVSHSVDEADLDPDGFLSVGKREKRGPRSFWNEAARGMARRLGMANRDEGRTGTSILVVPVRDPNADVSRGELLREPTELAQHIVRSAAHYYWPAIEEGSLQVKVQIDEDAPRTVVPRAHEALAPYLEIFEAAREGKSTESVGVKDCPVEVPAWKAKGLPAGEGQLRVAIRTEESASENRGDEAGPGPNRTALVRGSKMVVGYLETRARSIASRSFHGVAMAGRALGEEEGDQALETLLQRAEPVTHDRWDPNSEQLKGWRAAKASTKRILELIQRVVRDLTESHESATGQGPLSLRKLLDLGGEGDLGNDRYGSVSFPTPVRIQHDDGSAWMERDVVVKLPKGNRASPRPNRARALLSFGVRDKEGASKRAKDEPVRAEVLRLDLDGIDESALTWEELDDGTLSMVFDLEGKADEIVATVTVRTEPMAFERFAHRQFDVRVMIQRPAEEVQQ